jgi:hypothetical protein
VANVRTKCEARYVFGGEFVLQSCVRLSYLIRVYTVTNAVSMAVIHATGGREKLSEMQAFDQLS